MVVNWSSYRKYLLSFYHQLCESKSWWIEQQRWNKKENILFFEETFLFPFLCNIFYILEFSKLTSVVEKYCVQFFISFSYLSFSFTSKVQHHLISVLCFVYVWLCFFLKIVEKLTFFLIAFFLLVSLCELRIRTFSTLQHRLFLTKLVIFIRANEKWKERHFLSAKELKHNEENRIIYNTNNNRMSEQNKEKRNENNKRKNIKIVFTSQ